VNTVPRRGHRCWTRSQSPSSCPGWGRKSWRERWGRWGCSAVGRWQCCKTSKSARKRQKHTWVAGMFKHGTSSIRRAFYCHFVEKWIKRKSKIHFEVRWNYVSRPGLDQVKKYVSLFRDSCHYHIYCRVGVKTSYFRVKQTWSQVPFI
jgi:hypothetical protein